MTARQPIDINILDWIVGAAIGFLGLVGLYMASRGGGGEIYWIGLGLFVLCVLTIFGLVKTFYDRR